MTVKSILDSKGRDVATISGDQTLQGAATLLSQMKIGAVVVTNGDGKILGILSERDIVHVVATKGAGGLQQTVSNCMTAKVKTCREESNINDVMEDMTNGRFRHMPVEKDGKLAGIISIGDVVKRRIEDVVREAEEIRNYIAAG